MAPTILQTRLGAITLPPTPTIAGDLQNFQASVFTWTKKAQTAIRQLSDTLVQLNTSQIPQSGTGLYWSQALFDAAFSAKTTDNLSEGVTNLYFTTARARNSLSATSPIVYSASTGVFSLPVIDGGHA